MENGRKEDNLIKVISHITKDNIVMIRKMGKEHSDGQVEICILGNTKTMKEMGMGR
jgi:hypothetical protein